MITSETLAFLSDLSLNNHKDWFDENRKRYEAAKKNFLDLSAALIREIEQFDEGLAAASLDPKKTMMRINRDIRFSKDKTPYNSHFFTSLSAGGKSGPLAGYYLSVSPRESFLGAGLYMPDNETLNHIRPQIELHYNEWCSIVEDPELKTTFGEVKSNEILSRPPKGFDAESPAIEWLKRKGYYLIKPLSVEELQDPNLAVQVASDLRSGHRLVQFINQALKMGNEPLR